LVGLHQDLARTVWNHNGLTLLLIPLKHLPLYLEAKHEVEHNCLHIFGEYIQRFWHKHWVYVDFILSAALSMGRIENPSAIRTGRLGFIQPPVKDARGFNLGVFLM
jgi:hypothetical protein